jgi:hypothetical protein
MSKEIDDLSEEDILEALEGLLRKKVVRVTALGDLELNPEVEAAFNHEGSDPKKRN